MTITLHWWLFPLLLLVLGLVAGISTFREGDPFARSMQAIITGGIFLMLGCFFLGHYI